MNNELRGQRIKEARLLLGMSVRALAAKLPVTYQCVSCWERGEYAPRAEHLPLLAKALQIDIARLVIK